MSHIITLKDPPLLRSKHGGLSWQAADVYKYLSSFEPGPLLRDFHIISGHIKFSQSITCIEKCPINLTKPIKVCNI